MNKVMFKKYFTVVVASLLFFNVAFAQSNTSTEQALLNTIKQLQAQILSLQTQVTDLKTEVQSLRIELKFNRVLTQGTTGDDVKQLQEFLKTFTGSYPDGLITGYYGPRTAGAVKKFQAQNGIESVGVVGPKTQEKLNVLAAAIPAVPAVTPAQSASQTTIEPATPAIPAAPTMPGGPTTSAMPCRTSSGAQSQPASIKVLSPNGGEQWQIGGTYTIKYFAKDIVGNKALLIYLEKGYDAPTTKTGANSSLLIGVTTNLESYTYVVPQSIQSWPGFGSNYKITIMVEGSVSYCNGISYTGDSSDAEFSIVAGQGGVPGSTLAPNISARATGAPVSGRYIQPAKDQPLKDPYISMPASPILQSQIQILNAQQGALIKQFNSTTDTAARSALWAQITALGEQILALDRPPTTQDQIAALLEKISAYQNKLNNTTDAAARDSLVAQIAAFKAQIQTLENNSSAPTIQPAVPTLSSSVAAPIPILGTPVLTQANQDKINILYAQITALQNQLNSTLDTATRDSLVAQIVSLKAQVTALQTNFAAVSATQGMTTSGGGYIQPAQDKPTDTQVPENAVSTSTVQTSQTQPSTQAKSITVLSPNGGETLTIGKMYEIKWTGGNNSVDLYLLDNPTRLGKKIFSGIINNNYISWAASPLSSSDLSNYATPSGQYIILVNCTDGNCAIDFSDSYFKIIEQ